jgi:hypothetical protein
VHGKAAEVGQLWTRHPVEVDNALAGEMLSGLRSETLQSSVTGARHNNVGSIGIYLLTLARFRSLWVQVMLRKRMRSEIH